MIRRLSLTFLALGCLIATAGAAPMTPMASPAKSVATIEASHLVTGRSIVRVPRHYHRHHGYFRPYHRHYGWHHRWHRR